MAYQHGTVDLAGGEMSIHRMKRRTFVAALGSSAAWPIAARAQQAERMRRIGVLMSLAADDPVGQADAKAFQQGLQQLGWTDGRNVRIDYRWTAGNIENSLKYAVELVALAPDIILASSTSWTIAVKQLTRTVPIVFTRVSDPVGSGIVDSLARPGGNTTGFMVYDFSFAGKWLDLLREIAPHLTRVAVFRNDNNPAEIAQFGVIQARRPQLDCK
jgi:putative ABC transport system substrate-binding protein